MNHIHLLLVQFQTKYFAFLKTIQRETTLYLAHQASWVKSHEHRCPPPRLRYCRLQKYKEIKRYNSPQELPFVVAEVIEEQCTLQIIFLKGKNDGPYMTMYMNFKSNVYGEFKLLNGHQMWTYSRTTAGAMYMYVQL